MIQRIALITSLTLSLNLAFCQSQTRNNYTGQWSDDATWQFTNSPGFTNVPSSTIFGYVTASMTINMENSNGRQLVIEDTLVVEGDIIFNVNRNAASITVKSTGILIIFGDASMGKNNAGITVEAGGVLVVTGDVVDNGGGGNSIDATGDVYIGGSSGDVGGTGTVKPPTDLTGDGFGTIEDFINGGGATPLPVELLHFNASGQKEVNLSWATVSEINNDYFSIERSEDGENFYEIGRVNGNGTTNQQIDYSFTDKFPYAAIEYYRLKQVDYDGRFEHFDIVRVETGLENQEETLSVYPTIIKDHRITIKSNHPFQMQELIIYNLSGGKSINLKSQSIQENPLTYQVNTGQLQTGVYVLEATTSLGKKSSYRLIVK